MSSSRRALALVSVLAAMVTRVAPASADAVIDQRLPTLIHSARTTQSGLTISYGIDGTVAITRSSGEVVARTRVALLDARTMDLMLTEDGTRAFIGGYRTDVARTDAYYGWETTSDHATLLHTHTDRCESYGDISPCEPMELIVPSFDLRTVLVWDDDQTAFSLVDVHGTRLCPRVRIPAAFVEAVMARFAEGLFLFETTRGQRKRFGLLDPGRCRFTNDPLLGLGVKQILADSDRGHEIVVELHSRELRRLDMLTRRFVGEPLDPTIVTVAYSYDGACLVAERAGSFEVLLSTHGNAGQRIATTGHLRYVSDECDFVRISMSARSEIATHIQRLDTGALAPNVASPPTPPPVSPWALASFTDAIRSADGQALHLIEEGGSVFTLRGETLTLAACGLDAAFTTSPTGTIRAISPSAMCDLTRATREDVATHAWTPDGRFAVQTEGEGLVLRDLDTDARRPLSTAPRYARSVALSGDGRFVLLAFPRTYFHLIETQGGAEIASFDEPDACQDIEALADGTFDVPRCSEVGDGRHERFATLHVDPRTPSSRASTDDFPMRNARECARMRAMARAAEPPSLACARGVLSYGPHRFPRAGDCRRGDLALAVDSGGVLARLGDELVIARHGDVYLVSLDRPRVAALVLGTRDGAPYGYARVDDRFDCFGDGCAQLRRRGEGSLATAALGAVPVTAGLLGTP